MGWSLNASDDFSGASEVNGSGMTSGTGTWTVPGGNGVYSRSSGQLGSNAGSWSQVPAYNSALPESTTDQASEIRFVDASATGGPVTRRTASGYYYVSRGGGTTTLYQAGGSYPGTAIGSASHTATSNELCRLQSVANNHEVLYDGVSLFSATDSTHTAGRPGVWLAFSQWMDDYADYLPASGGQPSASRLAAFWDLSHNGRRLTPLTR